MQLVLFGSLFLAFSAPVAVFVFAVRQSPKLTVMMITSAFIWLIAALSTSILWIAVVPLKGDMWWPVLWGIFFQELFRYLNWRLLKRAETGLNTLAPDGAVAITREKQALVSGLGFGLMSTIMQFTTVLDAASGPGTLPSRGCGTVSLFVVSAILTGLVGILNIFWSIVMFRGLEEKLRRGTSWLSFQDWKIFFVVASHAFVSFLTLNDDARGDCNATILPILALTIITAVMSWVMMGMGRVARQVSTVN